MEKWERLLREPTFVTPLGAAAMLVIGPSMVQAALKEIDDLRLRLAQSAAGQCVPHALETITILRDQLAAVREQMEADWQIIHGYRCIPAQECDGYKHSCMWPRAATAHADVGTDVAQEGGR